MTAWQREAWKQRVWADAGLKPGAVVTALALADLADDDGLAVPGLSRLAEVSRCVPSTAYGRIVKLLVAGFVVRAGNVQVPGRPPMVTMRRYRLVIPDGQQ